MNQTNFSVVYDRFLTSVTSDLYMELTETDTYNMLQDLLLKAIHQFEFPRVNINDYTLGATASDSSFFNCVLSDEEIDILANYMIVEWLTQQLTTTENTRMKFSGSDFKFTSQANHMEKLRKLVEEYKERAFHSQRLYSRRIKGPDGIYRSTMGDLVTTPKYGYNIKES